MNYDYQKHEINKHKRTRELVTIGRFKKKNLKSTFTKSKSTRIVNSRQDASLERVG